MVKRENLIAVAVLVWLLVAAAVAGKIGAA